MLFNASRMWLADSYVYARFGRVCYGMRLWVSNTLGGGSLYETNQDLDQLGQDYGEYSYKAVVYIKPEMKLVPAGTNSWILQ